MSSGVSKKEYNLRRFVWTSPNGKMMSETRQLFFIVLCRASALNLKKKKWTKYKNWNSPTQSGKSQTRGRCYRCFYIIYIFFGWNKLGGLHDIFGDGDFVTYTMRIINWTAFEANSNVKTSKTKLTFSSHEAHKISCWLWPGFSGCHEFKYVSRDTTSIWAFVAHRQRSSLLCEYWVALQLIFLFWYSVCRTERTIKNNVCKENKKKKERNCWQ